MQSKQKRLMNTLNLLWLYELSPTSRSFNAKNSNFSWQILTLGAVVLPSLRGSLPLNVTNDDRALRQAGGLCRYCVASVPGLVVDSSRNPEIATPFGEAA
jgi:hypothetical protein